MSVTLLLLLQLGICSWKLCFPTAAYLTILEKQKSLDSSCERGKAVVIFTFLGHKMFC